MHEYAVDLAWEGSGTADYDRYSRQFRAAIAGKPAIVGSADVPFRGDPALHNPEDLLVVALASCHMLSYLALCARRGVSVLAYADRATGRFSGGRFHEVVLHPRVVIAEGADLALARSLHAPAHDGCFIARSVNFPVTHDALVEHGGAPAPVAPRRDVAVRLADRPGALAEFGEIVGRAGASLEGGGGSGGIVHFLIDRADAAAAALTAAGLDVVAVRDVVTVRLAQDRPGQLGALARAMADAGVNIETVYSDHDHQLVLVVDDAAAAARVAAAWR